MLVLLQFVGDAVTPLKVTVLLPCVPPKPVPVIVTAAPTTPAVGERLVMLGGGRATVRAAEPHTVPAQAVTVAVPAATPRTFPSLLSSLLIVATPLFEVLQIEDSSVCVLLSLKVPVAAIC
jgi:hypothetical protein